MLLTGLVYSPGGRAFASRPEGRWFESRFDHLPEEIFAHFNMYGALEETHVLSQRKIDEHVIDVYVCTQSKQDVTVRSHGCLVFNFIRLCLWSTGSLFLSEY